MSGTKGMTDHKFTDDEIIKMLKAIDDVGDCSRDCIFYDGKVHHCASVFAHYALEVIDRQNAKIKRLAKGRKNIEFETGDYAKIANNKSGHGFKIGTIVKLETCVEDYKAFANGDFWWVTDNDLVEVDSDTLVKEMTEGNNE